MFKHIVSETQDAAERAAIDAAWAQWTALASLATTAGQSRPWTIVDPEALVLASLAFGEREKRLEDMVAAWARQGSFLLSKPRLKSLASGFPTAARDRIPAFARYAAEAGNTSWKRLAAPATAADYEPRDKPLGPLRLIEGPALVLRLRAGFGVNAKADVLALLLGLDGAAAELPVLTLATGYTDRAIRTATEEMVLAGFVREIEGRPSSFRVDPEPWSDILQFYRLDRTPDEGPSLPPWHYWAAIFAFLTAVDDWGRSAEEHDLSEYVASSKARDLYEQHERQLLRAGVDPLPQRAARGTDFLPLFHSLVLETAEVARAGIW
jgi:hypothetical protein